MKFSDNLTESTPNRSWIKDKGDNRANDSERLTLETVIDWMHIGKVPTGKEIKFSIITERPICDGCKAATQNAIRVLKGMDGVEKVRYLGSKNGTKNR